MEPKDAVAYFESKGNKITWDWRDMWQEAHTRAFTVTSVARMDVLHDLRNGLNVALKEGKTSKMFADELTPILKAKGWWGTTIAVDPDGRARKIRQGSPARLELIYRQNMATAYAAGRYKEQLAAAKTHPFLKYIATLDQKTRPEHAALHGSVYRIDDPFWDVWYPPNGWRCRCTTVALSARGMEREKLELQNSEGRMLEKEIETINRDTGLVETRTVKGVRTLDGKEVWTDAGFSYNPGASAFGTDMELARKLSRVKDPKLYSEVVQSINNSELRHKRFAKDAAKILDTRRAGKGSMAVGLVDGDIAEFVRKQGCAPATILIMPERRMYHASRPAHEEKGLELTREEYMRLPAMVAKPEMVLWDKKKKNVVYVYPTADKTRRIIIIADMPGKPKDTKHAGKLDALVNAYTMPLVNLLDENQYERIK
jgi:SPP1 gp7 family putative phage head morphogenesis protein